MRPWTGRALAIGVDAVCLALFVALGRASHDISSGIAWYLTVLWPFLVGWFAVAAALSAVPVAARSLGDARLHLGGWDARSRLVLRAAVTQRSTPIAFIIVTYIFIGVTTFGWRLFVHGLGWVRSRDGIAADQLTAPCHDTCRTETGPGTSTLRAWPASSCCSCSAPASAR